MKTTKFIPAALGGLAKRIICRSFILGLTLSGALAVVPTVVAGEGGVGHDIPGSMATLIDLPPTKPGWVIETAYLHYKGDVSASRMLEVGGLLAANLHATSDALLLGSFYTFNKEALGAWYSVGVFVPYVWVDVTARVDTPLGSAQRRDADNGFGDVTLLPLMMGWKEHDWQFNAVLPIYAPTGGYEKGQLANPGLNYWTFDPTIGVSYNGAKNGFNAALHTGFGINTENTETNYRSGTVWHTEVSVQQLLPVGPGFLGIGTNAFFYQQITGDSGGGARLGGLEGRTIGIGPVLTYVLPVKKKNTLVFEARWLPELETRNRLNGDYFWAKLVYQF
jgi:hypothetical protein